MILQHTTKNELFHLVHHLDKHEKAYYKKLSKRYAENNQALHILLFEVMEQSAIADDALFIKKIGVKSMAQYSGLKKYLWNDLLAALVFQNRKNPIAQLYFSLLEADIMLSKNLIASAQKIADIAWQTATQFELYQYQTRILQLKFRILPYLDYKRYQQQNVELLQQQNTTVNLLLQQQQLEVMYRELHSIKQLNYLRLTTTQLQRVHDIKQLLLTMTVNIQQPLLYLYWCFNVAACYHLEINFEKCNNYIDKFTQLWQANQHLISINSAFYITTADYAFYNAFALKKIDLAEHYLQLYASWSAVYLKNKYLQQWRIVVFNTQLKIFHKNAQYQSVSALCEAEAKNIHQIAIENLPPLQAITVINSIAISWFVLESYAKAEALIIDSMNMNIVVQRDDILYFNTLFHLVILYERKQWLYLSQAINAYYLKLYHKKKLHPFEKELMAFLKQLASQHTEKDRVEIIQAFLIKLDVYRNDPVKDIYFLYFNYHGWLESKVQGVSYRQYVSSKITS
jgi:hypothetical protein